MRARITLHPNIRFRLISSTGLILPPRQSCGLKQGSTIQAWRTLLVDQVIQTLVAPSHRLLPSKSTIGVFTT